MFVTNSVRSRALVTLLAISAAACSELPTAPSGFSPEAGPLMSSGSGSDGSGSDGNGNSGWGQESGTRTFVVWPGLAVSQRFDDHVLYIPADAVCDPATSGYGSALWDAPCAPLQQPIEVTATWSVRNDRPVISFSPDLRFAPSDDESRWVKLSLKDTKGIDPDKYYAILWYNAELGQWVDESETDPTLKARANQSGNMVTRRLKHFSAYELWSDFGAYNVISGENETLVSPWEAW
jgi:hypothetical protein